MIRDPYLHFVRGVDPGLSLGASGTLPLGSSPTIPETCQIFGK